MLEVMIVMVIIGIVATIAVLALGDFGASRRIKTVATDLSLILPAVSQQAIFMPAILGVRISPHGYAIYQFETNRKTGTQNWVLIKRDPLLKPKTFGDNVALTLKLSGGRISLKPRDKNVQPQLVFLPDGNNNAFSISVGATGAMPRYGIDGSPNGTITLKPISP